jgi:hypothetical protein
MPTGLVDADEARVLGDVAFPAEPGTVVYVDRAPRAQGEVEVAGSRVNAQHACLLVFRDEMPGANWMHPCAYALVDIDTRNVLARVPTDRPPVFGHLPETWVVASDPGGQADLIADPSASA